MKWFMHYFSFSWILSIFNIQSALDLQFVVYQFWPTPKVSSKKSSTTWIKVKTEEEEKNKKIKGFP